MKKILSYLIISVLICSQSKAQQPSSHATTVDPALKDQWCSATIETCLAICKNRKTVPASNTCSQLNLVINCLCSDGYPPNLDNYENTVSYFVCEYNRLAGPCTNTCFLVPPTVPTVPTVLPSKAPAVEPVPVTPKVPTTDESDKNSKNKNSVALAIGLSASFLSAIIAISLVIWVRRRRKRLQSKPPNYFIPAPKRKISNRSLCDGPSVGRSLTSLRGGLVKDSNGSIGTNSSSGSIMQSQENSDGSGIVITKTHSVSVHQDNDYFGSNSFSHLSATNSIASVDYYNKFGSVENLTADLSGMGGKAIYKPGNRNSGGSGSQITSNDDKSYAYI
ncbi:3098_t:CDS:2 [Funneliformis mosseae]|uniref:3098_t:CDS:1 n=1 Tax=Funneliformis mosseae TaxID=27381 RepID=A0A9N8V8W7_FUNMO|nr:3098_t:CDS:2 [Funneliformis mosseae]